MLSKFPHGVVYLRTNDWYVGRWRTLSNWCDLTYGAGNWEYIQERFVFKTEPDKTMFILKWKF